MKTPTQGTKHHVQRKTTSGDDLHVSRKDIPVAWEILVRQKMSMKQISM
jgi:hypothetical protein